MQRRREHFNHVMNTPDQYSQATIDSFPSYDTHNDMANIQNMLEVQTALRHIAGNKVGGI